MSKSPLKVMLIDDDETILETLQFNLKRHGFETCTFKNGKHALVEFDEKNPSLVIIDWMLPDLVGPEICKLIRSRSSDVPILMLTGRARPDDVAEGLASGADDYLCKPFSVVELMARIQALLRRSLKDTAAAKGQGKIIVGELVLDDDAKSVTQRGKVVDLSPKEFSLLRVLMKNVGKTLSTEVLLNKVWGADFQGDTKTVAVHVRWLRQKLEEDPKNPTLLETVHRSGYRFNESG
ncbi:MAG: DNA-binding response regulator [Cyanobacteria bacterium PR.3.49]|nr:DNA-binding response regulator [Cyanobacteria bacterium PR.3.49]